MSMTAHLLKFNRLKSIGILLIHGRNFGTKSKWYLRYDKLPQKHSDNTKEAKNGKSFRIIDETQLQKPVQKAMKNLPHFSISQCPINDYARNFSNNFFATLRNKLPVQRHENMFKKLFTANRTNSFLCPISQSLVFRMTSIYYLSQIDRRHFSNFSENYCKKEAQNMLLRKSISYSQLLNHKLKNNIPQGPKLLRKKNLKIPNPRQDPSTEAVVLKVTVNIPLSDIQIDNQSKTRGLIKIPRGLTNSQINSNSKILRTKYPENSISPAYLNHFKQKSVMKNNDSTNYYSFGDRQSNKSTIEISKIKSNSGVTPQAKKTDEGKTKLSERVEKCILLIHQEKVKNIKKHVKRMARSQPKQSYSSIKVTKGKQKPYVKSKKNFQLFHKMNFSGPVSSDREKFKVTNTMSYLEKKADFSLPNNEYYRRKKFELSFFRPKSHKKGKRQVNNYAEAKASTDVHYKLFNLNNVDRILDEYLGPLKIDKVFNYMEKKSVKEPSCKYLPSNVTHKTNTDNENKHKTMINFSKEEKKTSKLPKEKSNHNGQAKKNKFLDWRDQCTNINDPDDETSYSSMELKRPSQNNVITNGPEIKRYAENEEAEESKKSEPLEMEKQEDKSIPMEVNEKVTIPPVYPKLESHLVPADDRSKGNSETNVFNSRKYENSNVLGEGNIDQKNETNRNDEDQSNKTAKLIKEDIHLANEMNQYDDDQTNKTAKLIKENIHQANEMNQYDEDQSNKTAKLIKENIHQANEMNQYDEDQSNKTAKLIKEDIHQANEMNQCDDDQSNKTAKLIKENIHLSNEMKQYNENQSVFKCFGPVVKKMSKNEIWDEQSHDLEQSRNLPIDKIKIKEENSEEKTGVYQKLKNFLTQTRSSINNIKEESTNFEDRSPKSTMNTEINQEENIKPKKSMYFSGGGRPANKSNSINLTERHRWHENANFPLTESSYDDMIQTIRSSLKEQCEQQIPTNREELLAIKTAEFCKIILELVKLFAISALKDMERHEKDRPADSHHEKDNLD